MDEPFGALDAQTRELLQEELQSIWRRDRKTALFVTHDIDEAIYLGTRIIVFSARPGRIKADIRVPVGIDRSSEFRKSPVYNEMRIQNLGPFARRGPQSARRAGIMIERTTLEKFILPLAMLAAWELAGRTGALPTYLSRPTAISAAIVELTQSGELPRAS